MTIVALIATLVVWYVGSIVDVNFLKTGSFGIVLAIVTMGAFILESNKGNKD